MSLDATAREANVRDSIKKYFVDNLSVQKRGTAGYHLSFDRGLTQPRIQGQPSEVEKWISVNFRTMEMGALSFLYIDVYCCAKKDNEGFKLAQLRDAVFDYLTDATQTDGMRRINFYRSYADQAWELLGAMVVQEVIESSLIVADDETKFKILTAKLRWGSKV